MEKLKYRIKYIFFVWVDYGVLTLAKFAVSRFGLTVYGRCFVDENLAIYDAAVEKMRQDQKYLMVDVGAHHGICSQPFLKAGWRVIAFEPSERNREVCHRNFLVGDGVVDMRALSSHASKAELFFESQQSTGISGLKKFDPTHKESRKVEVTTLTTALAEYEAAGVAYLKIDTEGNDLNVLRGFDFTANSAPCIVLAEFENKKSEEYGYCPQDLYDFLVEQHYYVMVSIWNPIKRYGGLHKWDRTEATLSAHEQTAAWGNFIACKDKEMLAEIAKNINVQAGQAV